MAKSPLRKSRKNILTKKTISRSHSKSEQLVWGIHPVLEALKACPQAIRDINVVKGKTGLRLEQILELAQENSIPVTMVSSKNKAGARKIDELPEHEKSQGISARIDLPTLTLEGLLDKLKDVSGPPLLLALDSIQDPHNLGAIIRSAVAAGVNGLILPKDRSAPLTGTVIKISAGSAFHINICKVTNLVNSFQLLKKSGIWIFGTTKDASQPVYDADLTVPACLVIGSEGKGLRPLVAEQCDLHISIPMQSSLDSLNASVAAGIILFEIVRQRRASPS
jgi:23S rRNA (guanosine2251-2'-O)-methyltransferase